MAVLVPFQVSFSFASRRVPADWFDDLPRRLSARLDLDQGPLPNQNAPVAASRCQSAFNAKCNIRRPVVTRQSNKTFVNAL